VAAPLSSPRGAATRLGRGDRTEGTEDERAMTELDLNMGARPSRGVSWDGTPVRQPSGDAEDGA
jgi:hypothetical protein